MSKVTQWEDCYVRVDGHILQVGNGHIERSWTFASGRPVSLSIKDTKKQEEWLKPAQTIPMFAFDWLPASTRPDAISVAAYVDDDCSISKPFLRTDVDMYFKAMERVVRLTIRIYASASFIRHEITILPVNAPSTASDVQASSRFLEWIKTAEGEGAAQAADWFQLDDNNKQRASDVQDYSDRLELRDLHCRWEAASFRDQTDTNNNLVSRDSGFLYLNEKRSLRGNILCLKKTVRNSGLLVIKEGATPLGHLQDPGMDFQFRGISLTVTGTGVGNDDLAAKEEITAYGTAVGVYDGDPYGCYKLINEYHRSLRDHRPERDSFIMSNTWGDRSKDSCVCEEFMLKELHSAAELGIEILQIDDGWEKGVTSNSVNAAFAGGRWSDYYSGDSDFWSVHPQRFPRGLAPVVELAKQLGIKLGLWYSPDSANDYANWEKDVETLLSLYREHEVCAFKLDGIDIRSKIGESRLLNMMRQVVKATGGRVDFNLDTTAQARLGYLGKTQYGSLFLENRYTDWKNYYPHWTLRNLWMLAPYVPATKLQIEFLNVHRNTVLYQDDPLAPAVCGQVYAFAVAAFANPLAWMELSRLGAAQSSHLAAAIQALKTYHPDILAGHVLPLGDEPSGTSWTGLQSITNGDGGYLLIIRERNEAPACPMKLWGIKTAAAPALQLTTLIRMDGKDNVLVEEARTPVLLKPNERGEYTFSRPAPFTFAIYRYDIPAYELTYC